MDISSEGASLFSPFNFPYGSSDIPLHPSSTATPVERLRLFISSLPTQTSTSTAVANLIRLLLLYTSRFYGCSHLLLGTSLTSLSVSLISGISQGSGFNIREETVETWIPPCKQDADKILINRPLRDITMKECALYAWWNGLKVLGRKKFVGGKQGIGALTRSMFQVFSTTYLFPYLRFYNRPRAGLSIDCFHSGSDMRQTCSQCWGGVHPQSVLVM